MSSKGPTDRYYLTSPINPLHELALESRRKGHKIMIFCGIVACLWRWSHESVLVWPNKHLRRSPVVIVWRSNSKLAANEWNKLNPCSPTCARLISPSQNVLSRQLRSGNGRYAPVGLVQDSARVPQLVFLARGKQIGIHVCRNGRHTSGCVPVHVHTELQPPRLGSEA